MSAANPSNDPSKPASSSPKKKNEPPHSSTSAETATTTAIADGADTHVTPTKAKSCVDLKSTPSAKHGSITAWGSTSGKLYLSSPRLNDPKSASGLADYFFGWAQAKKTTDQGDEQKTEKENDGENSSDVD